MELLILLASLLLSSVVGEVKCSVVPGEEIVRPSAKQTVLDSDKE